MDTGASWVRVYWGRGGGRGRGWGTRLPASPSSSAVDGRRLVAVGPRVPATSAVLLRAPAGGPPPGGAGFADEHLIAEVGERSPWPPIADVLVVRWPPEWASTLRAGFPGRLVTAYADRRGGAVLEVASRGLVRLLPLSAGNPRRLDVGAYASFVHAWVVAGRPLGALHGTYLGEEPTRRRGVRVSVTGRPAAWPAAS